MLKAIHKKSGELVSAYKLEKDASWIGKEKDTWIAPIPEIFNWRFLKEKGIKEVRVSYIKPHIRNYENEEIRIKAHFRIENEYAKPNPQNESEEHKLAKEGIYEKILDNELLINGKRIRDLFEIEDIDIEIPLSTSRYSKIVDVLVRFKEKDETYGKGLIFEIQISNQNFENTTERTYHRILEGYSVVWLWKGMFDSKNELINKNIILNPYLKAIEEYKQNKKLEYYEEINKYGLLIDKKIKDAKAVFSSQLKEFSEKRIYFNSVIEGVKKELIREKEKIVNQSIKELKEEIPKKLKEEPEFKKILGDSINYHYLVDIITHKEIDNLRENFQNKLEEEINEEIKKKLNEELIDETIKKIFLNIQKEYSEGIKTDIFIECNGCRKKFPVGSVSWEKSIPYCQKCFDELETNWKKRYIEENKKEDLERWSN